MRVVVVGAGYVGLVTGVCLSHLGHSVTCVDVDVERVNRVNRGISPIFEPGLGALLKQELEAGRFRAETDLKSALDGAELALIAVGTPSAADGSADLSWVHECALQISHSMPADLVVAIKSTVPAGTARRVRNIIRKNRPGLLFYVASNPEFLREGSAVADFLRPDRVVIGVDDHQAQLRLRELYAPLQERGTPIVETNPEGAELIKYASNSFLAMKLAFINEVAELCDKVGADVDEVALGMGSDGRIGKDFLRAGPGFGGSCFPKDTRAFAAMGARHGAVQTITEQVIVANERRKAEIAREILNLLGPSPVGKTVGVLGLAFKANTDDVRESASLTVIDHLIRAGVRLQVHDYAASPTSHPMLDRVSWSGTPYDAVAGADVVAVLTEWPDYAHMDFGRVAELMNGALILDTRRLLSSSDAAAAGLVIRSPGMGLKPKRTVQPIHREHLPDLELIQ